MADPKRPDMTLQEARQTGNDRRMDLLVLDHAFAPFDDSALPGMTADDARQVKHGSATLPMRPAARQWRTEDRQRAIKAKKWFANDSGGDNPIPDLEGNLGSLIQNQTASKSTSGSNFMTRVQEWKLEDVEVLQATEPAVRHVSVGGDLESTSAPKKGIAVGKPAADFDVFARRPALPVHVVKDRIQRIADDGIQRRTSRQEELGIIDKLPEKDSDPSEDDKWQPKPFVVPNTLVNDEHQDDDDPCFCGKESEFECTQCEAVSYCSSECQSADWPQHSKICKPPFQKAQHLENKPELVGIVRDETLNHATKFRSTIISDSEGEMEEIEAISGDNNTKRHSDNELSIRDVGARVITKGYGSGTLMFYGQAKFALDAGAWCGVKLDNPRGRNEGEIEGVKYFTCEPNYGIFLSARSRQVKLLKQSGWVSDANNPEQAQHINATRTISKPAVISVTSKFSSNDDDDEARSEGSDAETVISSKSYATSVGSGTQQSVGGWSMREGQVTQLHEAANKGHSKQVTELLSRTGGDKLEVDVGDHHGRTPLLHAVHRGRIKCITILLEAGANVNIQADDGSTALHEAAFNQSSTILTLLLSHGADPLIRDSDGRLPIHWSTDNPNIKCLSILAKKLGNCGVNVVDEAGMTTIMFAAYNDRPQHVKKLLQLDADLEEKDIDGKTAMDWAVHVDNIDCLRLLLDFGSTFWKDSMGRTVIHTAAQRGSLLATQFIIDLRKESIHDLDKQGRSPLFWAVACALYVAMLLSLCYILTVVVPDHPDVVRYLLVQGANHRGRDRLGFTVVDYAEAKQYQECLSVLTAHETKMRIQAGFKPPADLPRLQYDIPTFTADPMAINPVIATSPQMSRKTDFIAEDDSSAEEKILSLHVQQVIRSRISGANNNTNMVAWGAEDVANQPDKCLGLIMDKHGRQLAKYGNGGKGKRLERVFRVTVNGPSAQLIWARSSADMARYANITSAGIVGFSKQASKIENRDKSDAEHGFVVHTVTKTLYLRAPSVEEYHIWCEGLEYLLQ